MSEQNTAIEQTNTQQQPMSQVLSTIKWDTGNNGAQVENAGDVWRMCQVIAQSGLYPGVNMPAQAFIKAQTGAEMGFSINASMQNIHLIEGRCVLGGALMLARIINSAVGDYEFIEWDAKVCTIEWTRFKRGEWKVVGRSTWTIEEAKTAGLTSRKPWINTPIDMLRNRAIGRGARSFFPDLFMGTVYDQDEAEDFRDVKQVSGPVRGADAVAAKLGAVEPDVVAEVVPARTRKAKTSGEVQPASSTAITPAEIVVDQTEHARSTTTESAATSPITSPNHTQASSAPSASSEVAASSPSVQSAANQTSGGIEATRDEAPTGESQASTSGPTSETPPAQSNVTSTAEPAPTPSSPTSSNEPASSPPVSEVSGDAFVDAVLGMNAFVVDGKITASPATISAYVMKQQSLLSMEQFTAVRLTAMALHNKKNGNAYDAGFDDDKKKALMLALLVPGNPIE